jgi:hypothetical protein
MDRREYNILYTAYNLCVVFARLLVYTPDIAFLLFVLFGDYSHCRWRYVVFEPVLVILAYVCSAVLTVFKVLRLIAHHGS